MTAPREYASAYIHTVGTKLKQAADNARLSSVANSLIYWICQQMAENAGALADAQRSSTNVMTPSAAVMAQQNALIAALSGQKSGAAVISSTSMVIPAQGSSSEGFGGLIQTAMLTFANGSKNPSDLAQALLPLTSLYPTEIRKVALAMPNVSSVQQELKLCETLCSYVRRAALVQSVVAGMKVAPSKQPDASLTRNRLLEQIDEEIEAASKRPPLSDSLKRLRNAVVNYTAWFSTGGGGAVTIPTSSTGAPLAVTAADTYGGTAGSDKDLMDFNGVDHPLFGPSELDALVNQDLITITTSTS